jgi:hypothetical protein
VSGDAVDVVAPLKEESKVPLRLHGSLSLNRALMAVHPCTGLDITAARELNVEMVVLKREPTAGFRRSRPTVTCSIR